MNILEKDNKPHSLTFDVHRRIPLYHVDAGVLHHVIQEQSGGASHAEESPGR